MTEKLPFAWSLKTTTSMAANILREFLQIQIDETTNCSFIAVFEVVAKIQMFLSFYRYFFKQTTIW